MAYLIDRGAGPANTIGGAFTVVRKVDGEQTGGVVAVADHILLPRRLGSPRHTHRREHEISYVLEGTLGVEIGGESFEAGPGAMVFKPKDVPHAFWNPGDVEVRFVEVFAPAGFEHYFADLEPLIAADGLRPGDVLVGFASRRGPDAADDEIVRMVAEDPDPTAITVVTSDDRLAERVGDLGANVAPAGGFRRRLDDAPD